MTYAKKLRTISRRLRRDQGDPAVVLADFLEPFDMQPDMYSAIENEFWERKSLYHMIMKKISADNRVKENIQFGLDNLGNIVVEIYGRKRHGKSTVGRWLAQLRWKMITGSAKGWEEKVIYDQSYSGATNKIQDLANHFWRQACEAHEANKQRLISFFQSIRYYLSEMDENWIEHEKDSKKAENDLKNLVRTCAVAQIDFFFKSTVQRIKEVDFKLWTVGIDKKRNLNLSFYYDPDGECHGYLITPNIEETEKYWEAKSEGVLEMLLRGGRRIAKAKLVEAKKDLESPALLVPPDADFMQTLESYTRFYLQPLVKKPEVVERWILYYFNTNMTYKKIAQKLGISSPDTVGVSIRSLDEKITNTMKGTILEEALCFYLNQRFRSSLTEPPFASETSPNTNKASSTESFRRYGGRGAVDVMGPTGSGVAVNCKLVTEHRSSWQLHCSPEHTQPHPYLLLVELTPTHTSVHVYPIPSEYVDTGSVEELEWEAWLKELDDLVRSRRRTTTPPDQEATPEDTGP